MMPYITQDDRQQYDADLDAIDEGLDEYGYISGHVTYVLYKIMARWFKKQPSYSTICKIRGCLIGTLAEFDRRIAAPYEDKKIKENGDVDLKQRDPLGGMIEMCAEPECERCNEDEFGRYVSEAPDVDNRGGA
jgi:hypothetical protein